MPEPMPDGDIEQVKPRRRLEQFQRPGGDAQHQVAVEGGREDKAPPASASRIASIRAASKSLPCSISRAPKAVIAAFFSAAVAMGHDDGDGNVETLPGIGQRLAVIAAGGGDDAARRQFLSRHPRQMDQPAPHFEGADGRVVFMLDPDFGAGALARSGQRYCGVPGKASCTAVLRVFQFVAGEHQSPNA